MRSSVVICLMLLLTGCATMAPDTGSPGPTPLSGRLTFAGSTTVQPLVALLGENFKAQHPAVTLEIAAGGSVVGIEAVQRGSADIGMSSRSLTPEEAEGIEQVPLALDVLAVVVHPSNPVAGLTLDELRGIYEGEILNWQEVGGADVPILVVAREQSSGSRGAFDMLVLDGLEPRAPSLRSAITAGDVAALVATEPGAIGYVGFGNLEDTLKPLAIGGVTPAPESARDGSYPLVRPLLLLTGPLSQPLAVSFLQFVTSPEGQSLVAEDGWVAVQ